MIKPFLTPQRFDRALTTCADVFGVPRNLLVSKTRAAGVMPARFALYAACYDSTGAGYEGVGVYVHRDHTTVMHGVAQARRYTKDDQDYAAAYKQICYALAGDVVAQA